MCGIVGKFSYQKTAGDTRLMQALANIISHRGPDDEGFYADEYVQFGFRRLSILDLTRAGHQPMLSDDGKIVLIFNGEIYNYLELKNVLAARGHSFRSRSDTEVILRAYIEWGVDCVQHFNGMWSFALWDDRKKMLFCSRDRFGVKPFYYYVGKNHFLFASEIKALVKFPEIIRKPNHQRIYDYLVFGYLDHTDETLFEGILQLPPAHSLTITRDGHIKMIRYWSLNPHNVTVYEKEEHYAERFSELFEDAVRLRLRSDVSVGTCLSGGLDSSSIVCVVNDLLKKGGSTYFDHHQKTFSAVYAQKEVDEREFSSAVIKKTGAAEHHIFPSPDDILHDLQKVVYHQDEPFGSTSIFAQWYVMKRAHQEGIKVMLDGQGADELLGGYHPFFGPFLASLLQQWRLRRLLTEIRFWKRNHGYPWSYFLFQVGAGALTKLLPRSITNTLIRASHQDGSLFLHDAFLKQHRTSQPTFSMYDDHFQNELYRVLRIGLPALLHYEDRNSMAWSIEARVPFLDYRLVEYMFSIPNSQKISHGTTKVVLRNAMKGILPEKVRTRQSKLGFATPENEWLKNSFQPVFSSLITSSSFRDRGIVDAKRAQALFRDHSVHHRKRGVESSTIWRWMNLELWFRIFFDSSPSSAGDRLW